MNSLIARLGASALRHGLTYVGGFLVGNGIINGTQESDAIGALMTLAGIGWAAWQKYQEHKTVKDLTGKTAPIIPVVNGGPLPPVQ